jgi:protein-arginine kinase activator protein McsA
MELRRQLRAAVDEERFEEAARLRDLIRQGESQG